MQFYESNSSIESGRSTTLFKIITIVVGSALVWYWPPISAAVLPAVLFLILLTSFKGLRDKCLKDVPLDIRFGRFEYADKPGGLQGYAEYGPVASEAGITDWRKEVQRMPEEFKSLNPKVVMSETNIAGYVGDVPFFGTVDQVFEGKDGRLYIVDTKTHAKPTAPRAEEIVQLSVYRALLVQVYGEASVSEFAFIRSIADKTDGLPLYRRIRLLPPPLVEALAQKAKTLREAA